MDALEKRFLTNCGLSTKDIQQLNEVLNQSINDSEKILKWGNKSLPISNAQQYIHHIITQFLSSKNLDYALDANETRYNIVVDVKLQRNI